MSQNGTEHRRHSAARPANRRDSVRHQHAERIGLRTQWGALVGSLVDLSTSGAQVRLANGLVPCDGDEVTLRFVDGRHISGSIVWADRDALGIRFDIALPSVEDVIWLELREPGWFYAQARPRSFA